RGEKYGCGKPDCTVGCDCDRYIEVWNNVFSQFNSDGQGHYTELAHKNIDTGMGLERLACVCQDVPSLFDVDTVMNITHRVSDITGAHYGENARNDVSLRVITDHIRSATFLIGDGVLPSNEGRGYVLRRLLRRAARHGKLLGVNEPFLYKVCETVIHENRGAYPDLAEKQSFITRVIKTEEESFARTIDGGMRILGEHIAALRAEGKTVLSGADAFRLYDTYGFPLDLTEDILSEAGMSADTAEFDKLMDEQRERARAARGEISGWSGLDLGLEGEPTVFTGYDTLSDTGTVEAVVAAGELAGELGEGTEGSIVLDRTPFYAEMGGQVADRGTISGPDGAEFAVTDVQKTKGGKYLHSGKMLRGSLRMGDAVTASVDAERRLAIMRAHSATHLLHAALRKVLGDHVHQAGSLVEPDRLRFDFTHFSAMTGEELLEVARIVNHEILKGDAVGTEVMGLEEARAKGAQALFGEKYGESVRVVSMGDFSSELCGGTHIDNTAKVGPFRIESEFSVASGVRRIEAVTGLEFFRENEENNRKLLAMADMLKTSPNEVVEKARAQIESLRELRRRVEALEDKLRSGEAANFIAGAHTVGELKVLTATVPAEGTEALRRRGDVLREREPNIVAVLAAVEGEKITFLAVCGSEAVKAGVKAGDIIRQVTALTGGKGGGKPDSAMGGGRDVLMLDNALAMVDNFVAMKLGLNKE
ncbi:MAG TPA: alanine--tRNA ligase, partial [Candidatus Scatomorpha merdipullorum]|nr:alanine--tRNA ligase [Candidatus Scatomorpha merdipullorum]